MAYAPIRYYHGDQLEGSFRHKDTDVCFEYIKAEDMPDIGLPVIETARGKLVQADKQIFVGPSGAEKRYAYITKTTAYVVVDERDSGDWIVEKWNIKKHIFYKEL